MDRSPGNPAATWLRTAAAILLALGLAAACAGEGVRDGNLGGGPIGGGTGDGGTAGDAGDAGADAGDGGDGGAGDGGCAGALARPIALVSDGCLGGGLLNATLIDLGCEGHLYFPGAQESCRGRISGALNAFSGTCGVATTIPCTAASLPGTLVCARGGDAGTCTIVVCGVSGGGSCP